MQYNLRILVLFCLGLVGILFFNGFNSTEATLDNSMGVAYAQSEATPQPLPMPAVDQLRAIWQAREFRDLRDAMPPSTASSAASAQGQRAAQAEPRLIWVDVNAAPGGDGTEANPFATIQAGIDAGNAGDAVVVRPGLYTSSPLTMKAGVDVVGAVTGDPTQVQIQSTTDQAIVCADGALLQDVTVSTQQTSSAPLIFCTGGAPLFNGIIADQQDRAAISLANTTAALIFNSELSTVFVTGAAWLSGNLIIGTADLRAGTPSAMNPFIVDANLIVGPLQLRDLDPLEVAHLITHLTQSPLGTPASCWQPPEMAAILGA